MVQQWFEDGGGVEVSDAMADEEYGEALAGIEGLQACVESLAGGESPALVASTIEFLLEGLHLAERLNKESFGTRADRVRYGEKETGRE
mgnify:CR=1 FL=1